MAKKKMGGLGKGLDLLFADLPETSSDDAAASTLPLREIEPDPAQPRKQFDDDALNQLASSLRASAAGVPPGWPGWMRCRSSSRMYRTNKPQPWR